MPDVAFAVPGDLDSPTGGYIYDRRVMELLPEFGWRPRHIELPGDYPRPSKKSLSDTERLLRNAPAGAPLIIDGLAFGAMPAEMIDRIDRPIIGLVHHPLSREAGLDAESVAHFVRSEREALARTIHVIVTSPSTAELLVRDFAVPANKISVAEPGTEPAARARGTEGAPRLLSVGSVTSHKGYDVLLRALVQIADLSWESRIVGSLERDAAMVMRVRRAIERPPLEGRVVLRGALDDQALAAEYDAAHIFVLASHFEGYGMVFAEAQARGLPIVACAGGAVAKTVPADAGVLVPPGDSDGLALAVRRLLTDSRELHARAEASWQHGQKLPRWRDTAARFAAALQAATEAARA